MECKVCGYIDTGRTLKKEKHFIRTSNKIYVDNSANPYQLYICPKCGNVSARME